MSLIDTHCHLDAGNFAEDRDVVVQSAIAAGIGAIVVPAIEIANFAAVRDCCRRYPVCRPAYGIHPLFVGGAGEDTLADMRQWLTKEADGEQPPVAVGEIGLDFFYPDYDAAAQEAIFAEQLKIARDFDLPVLLHVRRAIDPVLKHLRRIKLRGGIAHAFNGSRQQADILLDLGFKLGFGGAMTHAGSTRIRQLAASLPADAIVLETDAPDIPPAWLSGGRNVPAELARIAQCLAGLRGQSLADLVDMTTRNARSVLDLPASM